MVGTFSSRGGLDRVWRHVDKAIAVAEITVAGARAVQRRAEVSNDVVENAVQRREGGHAKAPRSNF